MKQLFLILFLSGIFFYAEGQSREAGKFIPAQNANSPISTRAFNDTLVPLSFVSADQGGLGCFTGIYSAPDSGYVSGNNQYGDHQMAQFMKISLFTNDSEVHFLQNVLVNFGLKTVNDTPEDAIVSIYYADTTLKPGNLLAVSSPVNLSQINTQQWTSFSFPEVVVLPDSFYMSVQLPVNRGDTLAVLTSQDPCRQFSNWSFVQWKDFSWHTLYHTWILDIDLAIAPVIEFGATGIKNISAGNEAVLFPNPSADFTVLQLKSGRKILEYELVDESGRIVSQRIFPYGSQQEFVQLPVKELPAGYYLVKWMSGNESGTIPFVKN